VQISRLSTAARVRDCWCLLAYICRGEQLGRSASQYYG